MSCPTGISIDREDIVYVAERHHYVSMFTHDGKYLTSFGSKKCEPENIQFGNFQGIAVDHYGTIYVADTDNDLAYSSILKHSTLMKH